MRIRQVKPSWWLDKTLRKHLSADEREFYIGLWMQADDAGWFVWDEERIAAELYPYEPVSRRERNVAKWADRIAAVQPDSPHLVRWDCGHAQVPKMPGHQRITGKQTVSFKEKHLNCRGVLRVGEPTSDEVSLGRVGNPERNGTEQGISGAPSEFQKRVPRETALAAAK